MYLDIELFLSPTISSTGHKVYQPQRVSRSKYSCTQRRSSVLIKNAFLPLRRKTSLGYTEEKNSAYRNPRSLNTLYGHPFKICTGLQHSKIRTCLALPNLLNVYSLDFTLPLMPHPLQLRAAPLNA
ncbi:hypothetical protein BgiBS90_027602 [Biomphalaria glabrata]|nr:hypothetical protein BgiBS90_027602 [Biomphalaria glabrata]